MTIAGDAALALHLEVAATPTPGNVDRKRDAAGLRFETMQAGAVGAERGLATLADGAPVGDGFEQAVAGMVDAAGENTQFGSLLLLAPLVKAATEEHLSPEGVGRVVDRTTIADAVAFYRALDQVDVAVPDPPPDWDALDARRGSDAIPAVREEGVTMADVLARSAATDQNGAEWMEGFPRTFRIAEHITSGEGSILDRAADAHLRQLAAEPDTLVRTRHGVAEARAIQDRARNLLEAETDAIDHFAADLVERGINPGTTADLLAAGLFVALRRGVRP